MTSCQSLPLTSPYCFLLLEKLKRTSDWQPKQRRSLKPLERTQCESPCSCQYNIRHQPPAYPIQPHLPKKSNRSSDRNRKLQQGEAPSRAFPRHTSKMGHSWCQPTLLCVLKSDGRLSTVIIFRMERCTSYPNSTHPWTNLDFPQQSAIADLLCFKRSSTLYGAKSENDDSSLLLQLALTHVYAMQQSYSVACSVWGWPMMTPTQMPLQKSLKGRLALRGEACDIRWRPLRN